ncbi:MFS transporter [Streptomyces sp. NPDC020096]
MSLAPPLPAARHRRSAAYRSELGLSAATVEATFGLYALGLIPSLLVCGPLSDRFGRRPVMVSALLASVLASVLLIAGGSALGWLFAGRLIAGVASGAAFDSGAAYVTHHPALSLPCGDSDGLPIGLMLVGRHFVEATIYRAAHAYERGSGSSPGPNPVASRDVNAERSGSKAPSLGRSGEAFAWSGSYGPTPAG